MIASHLLRRAASLGRYDFPTEGTDATTAAANHFERNRAAFERTWPRSAMALPDTLPELEWLAARDGALSARHVDRQWFGDCSVPGRAADRMFARLHVEGPTAVLLAPTHAQQIRAVLDRLRSDQALIVVCPGDYTAGVIAACVDFSEAIHAGRLWLAAGPDWPEELQTILDRNEGLAPAAMMIRVPGLNAEVVDAIHKPCEAILAKHLQAQRQRVELLMAKPRFPRVPARRVCVVSGAFGLWEDAEARLGELAESTKGLEISRVDASKPTQRSALNFARAADGADAIVTANVGRADRANLVPTNVPWITWATLRAPAFVADAPDDRIVVADGTLRDQALAAGWPAARVTIGAEPVATPAIQPNARVAIICDIAPIVAPKPIEDMSSHRVIWDAVARDLAADPLRLGNSAERYLSNWCERVGVPLDTFPTALVLEALVAPTFAREVVRQLVKRGAAVDVWGRGWDELEEVRPMWRGPITDRQAFDATLTRTAALLDVWPLAASHPARRCGRPTVPIAGVASWNAALAAIKSAQTAKPTPTAQAFDLAAVLLPPVQKAA